MLVNKYFCGWLLSYILGLISWILLMIGWVMSQSLPYPPQPPIFQHNYLYPTLLPLLVIFISEVSLGPSPAGSTTLCYTMKPSASLPFPLWPHLCLPTSVIWILDIFIIELITFTFYICVLCFVCHLGLKVNSASIDIVLMLFGVCVHSQVNHPCDYRSLLVQLSTSWRFIFFSGTI